MSDLQGSQKHWRQVSTVKDEQNSFFCSALRVGSKAGEYLESAGLQGEVVAAVSGTRYLSTENGEIFWICDEGISFHRRCIVVPSLPPVTAGEEFIWYFPLLAFGNGCWVDIRTDSLGSFASKKVFEPVALRELRESTTCLLDVLSMRAGAGEKGMMRACTSAPEENWGRTENIKAGMNATLQRLVFELTQACRDRNFALVLHKGHGLIGLGQGLTPSGDDFLGGLLFAAWHLNQAYPGDIPWSDSEVRTAVDWARSRTHPISHAVFEDLTLGYGPEPLHELMTSLLAGKGIEPCMEAALRMSAIGHSSGWDILAGFSAGMRLIQDCAPP